MAEPSGPETIVFKCVVEKLDDGEDYEFSYTADKKMRLKAFKKQVQLLHKVPGALTLWYSGKKIRNEIEVIGNVLQPNDTLHIRFDSNATMIQGGVAEGAEVKGNGGFVLAEGGFGEGAFMDAKGNAGGGDAFGGGGEGPEGKAGKAFGGPVNGFIRGKAKAGDAIPGDFQPTGKRRQ